MAIKVYVLTEPRELTGGHGFTAPGFMWPVIGGWDKPVSQHPAFSTSKAAEDYLESLGVLYSGLVVTELDLVGSLEEANSAVEAGRLAAEVKEASEARPMTCTGADVNTALKVIFHLGQATQHDDRKIYKAAKVVYDALELIRKSIYS